MPLNKYVISVFSTVALLGLCLSVNAYAAGSDGGTCPAYAKISAHFEPNSLLGDPVDTEVFFDVIQIPRRIEVVTNQKTVVNNSDQGIKNIFFDYAKANVGKFGVKSVDLDGVFVRGHVFNTTSSQPPTGPCYKSVKQVEDERNRDIQKYQRASSAENLGWVKHVIIHHGYWYKEAKVAGIKDGQTFHDCNDGSCPDMVALPAGSHTAFGEDLNNVTNQIARFALGKTLVTQGQWRAIMGTNPSNFSNCGDDCPVESVNWNDAQEYVQKLSQKTGKTYRLPTEVEWEYACLSGQRPSTYCGGENIDSVA